MKILVIFLIALMLCVIINGKPVSVRNKFRAITSLSAGKHINVAVRHANNLERDDLRKAFKVFDSNGDSFIEPNELKNIDTNLDEKLTDEEIEEMMREADLDGDGKINWEEFLKITTII